MITGSDIREHFYCDGKCVKEKVIEQTFNDSICQLYPDTVIEKTFGLHKSKIRTDGIIKFSTGKWLLQECKRDVGINSVTISRAFLQTMYYLVRYFDNGTTVNVQDFKGFLLDSARFICYIPGDDIKALMDDFIVIYNKYYEVRPSEAYIIPEMNKWAISHFKTIRKYVFNLNFTFRFDLFMKDLYNNKI